MYLASYKELENFTAASEKRLRSLSRNHEGPVVILMESTIGVRQKRYPEFKVLHFSSHCLHHLTPYTGEMFIKKNIFVTRNVQNGFLKVANFWRHVMPLLR